MQANILNKIKKIIIAFIAIILTMQSVCFAGFTEQQQQEIINFANRVKEMNTAYTCRGDGLGTALEAGYNLQESYGEYRDRNWNLLNNGTYVWLCCATWVSCILNQCFGIDVGGNRNITDAYVGPGGDINPLFEEVPINEPYEVGDVMLGGDWGDGSYGHVWMYLGKINGIDYMTDCTSSDYHEYGNGKNTYGGVYVRPLRSPEIVIRYKGEATSTGKVPSDLDSAADKIQYTWKYRKVPFRRVDEGSIDKDKTFEYQGIGKVESQTTEEKENDLLAAVKGIWARLTALLEWILNFIFTIIKAILVGFGTLVQVLVTFYIDAVQGTDVGDRMPNGMMEYLTSGGLQKDIVNSVTLEKIIYNQVPILDVDVFNGMQAGGETLKADSLAVLIRDIVANFYMAMRTASLIGMLIALIYYGIKFVASGVAEAKAEYKQKLASWAIGFFIVFILHYFLITVMKVNELTVGLLRQIGTNMASSVSRRSIL